MRLVMYDAGDGGCPGILVGERVVDTRAAAEFAGWGADMLASTATNRILLSQPPDSMLELELAAAGYVGQHASASGIHSLDSVRLGPPVPDPEKIICIGLNYHDHAEEIGIAVPKEPIFLPSTPTRSSAPPMQSFHRATPGRWITKRSLQWSSGGPGGISGRRTHWRMWRAQ